ncbi:MAG: class I SAM-dependent methyltransferase [Candidatus Micrarchaeia archaeon]
MIGLKVNKKNAEMLRRFIIRHNLFDRQHKILDGNNFIYFPIVTGNDEAARSAVRLFGAEIVNANFARAPKAHSYKELVAKKLGKADMANATKRYDLLGNIAIIDSDNSATAKRLAKAIMYTNRNVYTVIRKGSAVSGIYRTRKYKYVAGKRNFVANYKENGAFFSFDVRKVFFSPRLAYERKRVSDASSDGENVMVMFAGVGPFAIEIAKAHPRSNVVAIELNRHAYNYMLENIRINKLNNVTAVQGDVKKVAAKYKGFADRIVMPLPKSAANFLESAYEIAKEKCVVHYYTFGNSKSAIEDGTSLIRNVLSGKNAKVNILGSRVVRPYSADQVEIVIDFELVKRRRLQKAQKDI